MKTLKDLGDLKGKRVLVRADFNVPLDGTTITDDGRIKAALPTIEALRKEGAKVILMAHLGRPKGKVVPELSLAPVAARLSELLGVPVVLASDTYGEDAQAKVAAMKDGDVVLLENVRFNPEETSKDEAERAAYAKKLAALGDVFVSDGFGVVHRAQGSDYDVAADLPAAAGLLVEKEVNALSKATEDPERPFTVVLGGSKVSDKLGVIENLLDKADRLVIGGGMVFTFLKAKGYEVGTSLLEEDMIDQVKGYIETADKNGVELVLPVDIVVNKGFPAGDTPVDPKVVPADQIPSDMMGLDIDLSHASCSTTRSSIPRRSYGTARWASSRFLPSRQAPRPSPRLWWMPPNMVPSPSSAVVIPLRPCVSSDSPKMASRTSPRAAAPLSNSSRARSFLASRSSVGIHNTSPITV